MSHKASAQIRTLNVTPMILLTFTFLIASTVLARQANTIGPPSGESSNLHEAPQVGTERDRSPASKAFLATFHHSVTLGSVPVLNGQQVKILSLNKITIQRVRVV